MLVASQIRIINFKSTNGGYDVEYFLNGDLKTLSKMSIITPDYVSTQREMKEYVLEELNKYLNK